jgi:hypothetical protein
MVMVVVMVMLATRVAVVVARTPVVPRHSTLCLHLSG